MNENIYIHSFETAREQGETEQYSQSAAQNRACASAIDKAIAESNYDQYHYNLSGALTAVTADFGLDRVIYVVAGLIQSHEYDGRYSRVNKEWARYFHGTVEDTRQVVIYSHPTLVDGFSDEVRAAQLAFVLENPLETAEMGMEQNFNQIDGIINNQELPHAKAESGECLDMRQSIRAQLKENSAQCEKQASAPTQKKDARER